MILIGRGLDLRSCEGKRKRGSGAKAKRRAEAGRKIEGVRNQGQSRRTCAVLKVRGSGSGAKEREEPGKEEGEENRRGARGREAEARSTRLPVTIA